MLKREKKQAGLANSGSQEEPAPQLRLNTALVRPGERVGVAVSGGADSVALLLAMVAANQARRGALGVGLSVVHMNHGIRGEAADEDADFVARLATELDLPLHRSRVDVPARAAAERETLEEAARNARYAFFRNLIARGELDVVATAHTLDDQAETVLMKLLRGAWLEGLSGIHPVVSVAAADQGADVDERQGRGDERQGQGDLRQGQGDLRKRRDVAGQGRIVRPMLGVSRTQVEAYLRNLGQRWRQDATNLDLTHTRNRVRHELMPVLRSFNPKLQETLAHVATLARDEEARWSLELERLLPQVLLPGRPVRGGGRSVSTSPEEASAAIELERLRTMDPALRRRVLRAAARQLGCAISFEHTERLMTLCADARPGEPNASGELRKRPARTGSRLELPDGLRAERTGRELRLWRAH